MGLRSDRPEETRIWKTFKCLVSVESGDGDLDVHLDQQEHWTFLGLRRVLYGMVHVVVPFYDGSHLIRSKLYQQLSRNAGLDCLDPQPIIDIEIL